jgi:CHAT domain-containing protein
LPAIFAGAEDGQTTGTTARSGSALVVGNPVGDLPFAEVEAREVARVLDTQPMLGESATRDAVLAAIGGVDIVHIASHASFDTYDSFKSSVVLANGSKIDVDDLLATNLRARMVVLSGCQTGLQSVAGGEELHGLVRALQYAGAESVVVSLWNISDETCGKLMASFYRRVVENGEKPSSALREAMIELRSNHPATYHWAPFMVYGRV